MDTISAAAAIAALNAAWHRSISRGGRAKCPWAEAYYRQKRQQGLGQAAALRCLAMRWLKILWKMWTDRTPYDGERHLHDQVKHGSWVIALMPQPTLQPH